MRKILGLDLGTNSIGWALIEQDFENKTGHVLGMGSRIIPMSQDILGDFEKGNSISQTAERTRLRSTRRLRERHLLRRERLHRILNILGFLPQHYASSIDFDKNPGKFLEETEPKLAYQGGNFLFKESFMEMLEDFRKSQPDLLNRKNTKGEDAKIPYDWTIYYLRQKALKKAIAKEELSWLILNFNQKRGYYQRGEEDEISSDKLVEFHSLKVTEVIEDEHGGKKSEKWYSLILENGWVYRRSSKVPLFDWAGKTRDFIVTTDLNKDGSVKKDKDGLEKRSFRAPNDDDWTLRKKRTEHEIQRSGKTVGQYIYDTLLRKPEQKINGELIRTIEREFYKDELRLILTKQSEFHPELKDETLYAECVRELYRNNESHRNQLASRDFIHLFLNDILFYHRPLRSQKSSIGNCSFEFKEYKDANSSQQRRYLKAISKSNPYYQEFRIWQWIYNLSIYNRDSDKSVNSELLSNSTSVENLFEFLNSRKEIEQKALIKFLLVQKGLKGKELNTETEKFRWNYVEDKKYPCNETRWIISSRLENVINVPAGFLTRQTEQRLWHIMYSVIDKTEYQSALRSFAQTHQLDTESFVEAFVKFPPFKSEYGTYSERAIKKLLPLMRLGKYWSWEQIDDRTKARIKKIMTGEYDAAIKDRVREKAIHLTTEHDFQGLQLWLAQYIVYDRHSEAALKGKWNSIQDLDEFLSEFRQHSLRNPIVEQVVIETLRVVKDIWAQYGGGQKDFFDEIHIELAREMKKTKDQREKDSRTMSQNENTNLRIKALLAELVNDGSVENVRPYSPMQQEILKVYEEGVLQSHNEIEDDILKISKTAQPTPGELKRYKLWLEQKYRSPYTGDIIPLNKLFTPAYEIEHIIPQSRFFDNSLSNKIICESAVNKLKDNQLAYEFIRNHHGEKVLAGDKTIQILEVAEYEEFIKQNYSQNRSKSAKLLMDDIPVNMIERQLNDTRYISKFVSNVLSNIVRSEANDDGVNSKNLLPGNGKVTAELRQDWGLNDVWNDLILPRFERLNRVVNTSHFTAWSENHQKFLPTVPIELSRGFSKKRIDHRHHALDALVIACTTRDHVNLLNNTHAATPTKRYDLNRKLRRFEKTAYTNPKTGERIVRDVPKDFLKPWEGFTADARNALENIVVSFKQNQRIINKATNHYKKWSEKDGRKAKQTVEQTGTNWAVRKPLHKDTVSGKVHLPGIKVPKGKILTATRKSVDLSFDNKRIETITDRGIQKILKNYLNASGGNPEVAFSAEGLEDMNKNIERYNDGKSHQPIYKARVYELGSKFPLGQTGNKTTKYVEAAKGTNLFFAIYQDHKGKRTYDTIPLNVAVEREKQGLSAVPFENEKGDSLLFYLSPNDLVYVPTPDEMETPHLITFEPLSKEKINRIYKMVSSSGSQCFFVKQEISSPIVNKVEFSALNKMEKSIDGEMIKETSIKLKVDRLGNFGKHTTHQITNQHNLVSEPATLYEKRSLKIFKSFDEMEDDQLAYFATLNPSEILANHKRLSLAAFGFKSESEFTKQDRKIKFQ